MNLRKKYQAFTLLELMVVVFIISVLAAVAIPMVGKYLKKSKTSEVGLNLRKIYDGEIAYFQEERVRNTGSALSKQFIDATKQPSTGTLGVDKRFGNWEGNWALLKFGADGPVLFEYSVIADGLGLDSSFTARAHGDIDGDGITSLFERMAKVNSVTGEPEGSAAIFSLDDIE